MSPMAPNNINFDAAGGKTLRFALAVTIIALFATEGACAGRYIGRGEGDGDLRSQFASNRSAKRCVEAMPGAAHDDRFLRQRTLVDQPDDAPDAYQIHVLYVEPGNRSSVRSLDTDGSLRRSITAFNAWLFRRTGDSRLRFDTCDGVIDVTYVQMAPAFSEVAVATGAELAPHDPPFVRERVAGELRAAFNAPKKLYLVYYDGLTFGRCGGAPYPPLIKDHFTLQNVGGVFWSTILVEAAPAGAVQLSVFDPTKLPLPTLPFAATIGGETVTATALHAGHLMLARPLKSPHAEHELLQPIKRAPDCRTNNFSHDGEELNYWEYSALHECLHPLGIVAFSATDYASAPVPPGHTKASGGAGTRDLMYAGAESWRCPTFPPAANASSSPGELDPQHRNYFRLPASMGGAVDLSRSAVLDPTPQDAGLPAGW
ncbi:MAG: hypothetical protein NVSMB1_16770 [Polyangiales bacterium]